MVYPTDNLLQAVIAMPHKHRRDKLATPSLYNLPPSQLAYPLPTTKQSATQTKSLKRKSHDDTPRAFSRLLGPYRPPRSGLDDGIRPPKKRRTGALVGTIDAEASLHPTHPEPTTEAPTRQHNESLSSFAARVDAALPLSGIQKKSGTLKGLDKGRQTRTERKMQKMYKQWREEDKRMKEEAEEVANGAVDNDDEEVVKAMGVVESSSRRKSKKRKGKQAVGANRSSDDEDPWAGITAKRKEAEGAGGLIGLHDVVQAPPRFTKAPKERVAFKMGQGGLKRQAELSEARQTVVKGYRQMMKERRAEVGMS